MEPADRRGGVRAALTTRTVFDQRPGVLDDRAGADGADAPHGGAMPRARPPETDHRSPAARVPFRTVLASMGGLWLAYFLLVTLRGSLVGLELQGELLWRRVLVTLGGVAVTWVLWRVIRLFERRAMWLQIVVAFIAALPAAAAIAQLNEMVFAPIEDAVTREIGVRQGVSIRRDEAGNLLVDVPGPAMPAAQDPAAPTTIVLAKAPTGIDRWRQFTDVALGRYFLLIAWAALYLALVAAQRARLAEREGQRLRSAAKAAELRSLRYQVNPHFLFNTLNSLSALVMTGKEERAEQMIHSLSRFYRHSLAEDPTGDVLLQEELELQALYLEIESVRFPDRLRVTIDCPPELARCRVPGMILQPLVENSVKYGVSTSSRPVTITIRARAADGQLLVTVADDGPGTAQGAGAGFGIGIGNVRDRLRARFGAETSVVSGPTATGYETRLALPLVRHG